jgi:hypothetical protein
MDILIGYISGIVVILSPPPPLLTYDNRYWLGWWGPIELRLGAREIQYWELNKLNNEIEQFVIFIDWVMWLCYFGPGQIDPGKLTGGAYIILGLA